MSDGTIFEQSYSGQEIIARPPNQIKMTGFEDPVKGYLGLIGNLKVSS